MAPTANLHMVSGDGDTSYARNSTLQSGEQGNVKPMIDEAVASFLDGADKFPDSLAIADLGCSSGPNTLVLVTAAVDAVRRHYLQHQQQQPELCIHLNDLPKNDFNSVINSLVTYKKTQEDTDSVLTTSIVPGSFYGRLFPRCSLHLVCSTVSLHWLSEEPQDLVRNRIPFYASDEAVRRARRGVVVEAYARQFNKDLTRFLGLRAQEMVPGGRMVFSMLGQRSDENPSDALPHLELMACALHEMASMGLIDKEKLDSFYPPLYGPSEKELKEIVEAEGSFVINKIAVHEPAIYAERDASTPRTRARWFRAVMEPLIVHHFGASTETMDEFVRVAERLITRMMPARDEYPSKPRAFVAASLTRRA